MKIKISIVMFVLLSFFNIGAISNIQIKENSFGNLEYISMNKSEFVENGVKLQYKTQNSINSETSRIKDYFSKGDIDNYDKTTENEFNFYNDNSTVEVKLWNDSNFTYTSIIIINKSKQYKTSDLKNIINKLENSKLQDVQYFCFYKGKINNENKNQFTNKLKEIINEANIKNVNILVLNNGCTGTGYCRDGNKVNLAMSKYDTGSYIMIGTPIIFTTY